MCWWTSCADGVTIYVGARQLEAWREKARSVRDFLQTLVGQMKAPDYLALLPFFQRTPARHEALQVLRGALRNRLRVATTLGYGPRYLHSTGQLHKGGPNTGVFVMISATPRLDVPVPDEPFSFGTLEYAQALGDFASLEATGRRALHVHLPSPDRTLLR